MHPVLFWIVVSCFVRVFFSFWRIPYRIVSWSVVGCLGPSAILESHSLSPCASSMWDLTAEACRASGGLSCLLLPDNFTSCNYLTHSFFSWKDKWKFWFFLFTGCYPTRAFWGHVHSSWCNLSPSEYPGKLHCVFSLHAIFSTFIYNLCPQPFQWGGFQSSF